MLDNQYQAIDKFRMSLIFSHLHLSLPLQSQDQRTDNSDTMLEQGLNREKNGSKIRGDV
jgi:hypothetical protein